MPEIKTTRSRRASAPKKPKTKPAAKPEFKTDFVMQTELRAVIELYDIAQDLAIEIRRRILHGARVERGRYTATASGGAPSIANARRHRENCGGTELMGLDINQEAANA